MKIADSQIGWRSVEVNITGAKEEDRSIPVTLATENPVKVYDRQRGLLDEYLDMSGVVIPKQVPMVDSHRHDSMESVLGSVRELATNGPELTGRAYFSRKPLAVSTFNDVRDQHVTDISVGFRRIKERYIEAGKTENFRGQQIKGPARIVEKWQPFEGSPVTVGADRHSTFGSVPAMRAYLDPNGAKDEAMIAEYRAFLVSQGMPESTDDTAAAAWAKDNLAKRSAPDIAKPDAGVIVETKEDGKRAAELERHRVMTIRNAAELAGVGARFADALIASGEDSQAAQAKILAEQTRTRQANGIAPAGSERENFRAAVLDGFSQRIGATVAKPAPGASEFRGMRFLDMARKCADREGIETRSMEDRDIVRRLFSDVSARASDGQAYLVSGNFSNLLLDAQNKQLLKAYTEYPTTYQMWVGTRPSVPDFKNINVVRLGEVGNQPTVEENGDYKDMSMSDSKEVYRVEKRGSLLSLTYEAMRNDDLGGFSRLVTLQGSAMKRTINQSVYQIFFDNAALSDGTALFASGHGSNTTTGSISVTSLNTAWSAMMLQTGINTDVILGITPSWLIVPPGISGTAYQLITSMADPAAGGSAAGNSNTQNIYGPGGSRGLNVIVEPILAGNDVDAWYLAASSNLIDTIQLCFLQGEESPVFEQETAFVQDAVKYKIRQTWGCAAVDYRGLYRSTG